MILFTYDLWLVGLSVLVSMMSAFAGLSLARGLSAVSLGARQVRIVMASIALGGGIWSMHFAAMLAMRFGVLVYYRVIETVASALIAILLAGLALLILHFGRRRGATIVISGSILGLGIVGMHYVGLSGIDGCLPVYTSGGIGVAGALAMVLGIVATHIAYRERTGRNILIASVVFGLSTAIVHFAAMATTRFKLVESFHAAVPVLANSQVAIIVLFSAFVISGTFLVLGASFLNKEEGVPAVDPGATSPHARSTPASPHGRSTPASVSATAPATLTKRAEVQRLPYQKDGRTFLVGFDTVLAIESDGHYTTAYLDTAAVFCPWSISQADAAVPQVFIRVHRQWLVNMAMVQGFERTKDNGFCLMAPGSPLSRVPVSRAKVAAVREALGL